MNRRIRVLLVDDEELARHRLRRLLDKMDIQVEIVGEAEDGFQAVELIESVKSDVVFLDIQMPGLDGFEVINKLSVIPQIIFCTAFEEYAVKAFEAKDKYVDVISRKGQTYLSDLSLKRLEELLPNHFVRVHRAIIVNRMNIHEVRRYLSNRFILVMNDENRTRFTTGRIYVDIVKGLMTV